MHNSVEKHRRWQVFLRTLDCHSAINTNLAAERSTMPVEIAPRRRCITRQADRGSVNDVVAAFDYKPTSTVYDKGLVTLCKQTAVRPPDIRRRRTVAILKEVHSSQVTQKVFARNTVEWLCEVDTPIDG